jgi:translation initiation factor IF-1
MSKDDYMPFEGEVIRSIGHGMFTVKLDDNEFIDTPVLCTLSGKIKKNSIKIIEGDRVKIGVATADITNNGKTHGIINYRSKR